MLYTYSLEIPQTGGEKAVKVVVNGNGFELNLGFTDSRVLLKPINEGSEVEVSYKPVGSDEWIDVVSFTANPSPPSLVTLVGSEGAPEVQEEAVTPILPPDPEPPVVDEAPINVVSGHAVASSTSKVSKNLFS